MVGHAAVHNAPAGEAEEAAHCGPLDLPIQMPFSFAASLRSDYGVLVSLISFSVFHGTMRFPADIIEQIVFLIMGAAAHHRLETDMY